MQLRFVIALMLASACGSSGTSNPPPPDSGSQQPNCQNIAGRWDTDGGCGNDLCNITQNGCAITQVMCNSGARSTSGTINGSQFSYTGMSGTGLPATCSGTLSGNSIAGTCNVQGVPCSFTGQRQ